jgi:gamma-glutamylcyclotransferase (GGCT)/AIG2-like uncharacterized protein YtfP
VTAISDRLARASSNGDGRPDRGSAGTPELFVYGTLVLDDVVRTLIDRVPASGPVTAPGWRAAQLPERPYPGLVADSSAEAPGRVYKDLTEREWATLDAFEDPAYLLTALDLDNGRRGLAYVWPDDPLPGTWTVDSLDPAGIRAYLDRCQAWRDRYDAART